MSSCSTRTHDFLFNKRTCRLVDKGTCLLVGQETCLLVHQDDMPSCWTRWHVLRRRIFLLNKKACLLVHMGTKWVVLKIHFWGSHTGVIQHRPMIFQDWHFSLRAGVWHDELAGMLCGQSVEPIVRLMVYLSAGYFWFRVSLVSFSVNLVSGAWYQVPSPDT